VAQAERCRGLLERSRQWVGFEAESFRDTLSCALELLGAERLARSGDGDGNGRSATWTFPVLDRRAGGRSELGGDAGHAPSAAPERPEAGRLAPRGADPGGGLRGCGRARRRHGALACGAASVQRLLARFRAQGFVHHDLSRACLAQAQDSIPRVVLLGRLCLYGRRAERLHEEIVPLAARWVDPARRSGPLRAYAREAETRTLDLLDQSLTGGGLDGTPDDVIRARLLAAAPRDVEELLPQLEPRAAELAALATRRLGERGEREARDLEETLRRQRERIVEELDRHEGRFRQITLGFDEEERRQPQSNMRYWRTAHAPRPVRPGPDAGAGTDTGVLPSAGPTRRAGRARVPLAGDELRRLPFALAPTLPCW